MVVGTMSRFWQFCVFKKLQKCIVPSSHCAEVHYILHKYSVVYVVSGRCFRFAIHCATPISEVMRLESAEVGEKSHQNLQIFAPQNVADRDRALSDLRYKITPHSDIVALVPRGAFFGLED